MCNGKDDGCGRCSARKFPDTEKEHFTCELAPYKAPPSPSQPPRPVAKVTPLVRDEHGYVKYADIAKSITHEANVTCVAKKQRMEGYDAIVPVAVCKTRKPLEGWEPVHGTVGLTNAVYKLGIADFQYGHYLPGQGMKLLGVARLGGLQVDISAPSAKTRLIRTKWCSETEPNGDCGGILTRESGHA
ncbi:hypothetical protein PCL_00313 [Purpureocillium lilacinum]|uniref:Uncharacterized protein n=1 Tax=Purpureocillium lilacinum TaxID=33203 RepID=A0A2U3E6S2_PURLI|nr:hypothetical protein Purlil1_10025 [Purpureocillium lilacinum]PWI70169.1 hypothetical protein PCL_00313 [Purpureocillium lilacinum]